MNKLNVCVIFGGVSSEHDISRLSVKTVLNNIDTTKYDVYKVAITKEGKWLFFEGDAEKITEDNWLDYTNGEAIISPDRSDSALIRLNCGKAEKIHIDVIYPVLHGKYGEDGTIQGLFDMSGIPYTAAGCLGSAVCMDKCVAKILFEKAGIKQADWVQIKRGEAIDYELIEKRLGYPVFVKPSSAGSSVGVTKVMKEEELKEAVDLALMHDYKVLIEEAICAREVEMAVMGNLDPVCADFAGEIKPAKEFYDFEAKYEDENSGLLIPAPISEETLEIIKDYAKRAYKICECRGYSRVDFFVEKNTGEVYLNEINTIPGFTPISMYPKLWENSGVSIKEVIDRHISLALERMKTDC